MPSTLAPYVVVAAGRSLWRGGGEAFSWPGLAVAVLSIPIMLVLARRKLAVADRLGSRARFRFAGLASVRRSTIPARSTPVNLSSFSCLTHGVQFKAAG
jgi:divalent metal cation (Fe/Co/Zn/Cd) transporter